MAAVGAEQVVLDGCGHVPQIERPAQTLGLLRRLFAHADGRGGDTSGRFAPAGGPMAHSLSRG